MATEMPTDQTQVYPLALRQYLHQMVLEYHFCLISPFMEENIARIRGSGQKWAIAIGKMMNSQPWIFGRQSIIFVDLPEKFCSPRCPQHFPGCSYFVGVASGSLDRNLSISRSARTGRPQGKDWMCFLPRLPQGRSLRQIAHVHASQGATDHAVENHHV